MVEYKGYNIPETAEECFQHIHHGVVSLPTVMLERTDGTSRINTAISLEKIKEMDDIPGALKRGVDEFLDALRRHKEGTDRC